MKNIFAQLLHQIPQQISYFITKLMRLSLIFLAFVFCSANSYAQSIEIEDDRGHKVQFAKSPQRIVSILPSLTETVCALGHCQRLVGVDRYSNFPESVTKLPQVGGGLDPNIEAIVALKPDVVLMATSSRVAERLQGLGIKIVALEPKTHADVRRILGKIGQLLEVKDADKVWREIDHQMETTARTLPPTVKKLRVYFEVSNAPFAAGESSFIGEILQRLGAGNIVPASLGPFPKLNPEFIVRANPDVIMVGQRGFASMETRPGWQAIRAIREKRICVFTPVESDILVRPGPRMAEAVKIMADCLNKHAL